MLYAWNHYSFVNLEYRDVMDGKWFMHLNKLSVVFLLAIASTNLRPSSSMYCELLFLLLSRVIRVYLNPNSKYRVPEMSGFGFGQRIPGSSFQNPKF